MIFEFISHNILSKIRRNYIAKLIGNKGKTVLDVGCRTIYLKKKVEKKGMKYYAIDINPTKEIKHDHIWQFTSPNDRVPLGSGPSPDGCQAAESTQFGLGRPN